MFLTSPLRYLTGAPGKVLGQACSTGQAAAETQGTGSPRTSLQPVQGIHTYINILYLL